MYPLTICQCVVEAQIKKIYIKIENNTYKIGVIKPKAQLVLSASEVRIKSTGIVSRK